MKIRGWQYAVVVALGLSLGACGDDEPTGNANTREIRMLATTFSPSDVTINRGVTVRWVNDQAIAHNITPANPQQAGVWTAQNIPATAGASFSFTFNTAGVFNYSCTIHLGMTGRITVN